MDAIYRFLDGDVFYSFKRSPVTIVAFIVTVLMFIAAIFAPWIAPHNTSDIASLDLMNAFRPPAWTQGGDLAVSARHRRSGPGRAVRDDVRPSHLALCRVRRRLVAAVFGTLLGLLSGYVGGWLDSLIMRIADIQLTFPAILIALLFDGIVRSLLSTAAQKDFKMTVLILAIAASQWVNFRPHRARLDHGREEQGICAGGARDRHSPCVDHASPRASERHRPGPGDRVRLSLAIAILTEATLSFLGVGVPVTQPSLGTLIRIGNDFLFSGEWWMTIFPGIALVVLVLAVNLLGDWLRDALNPKLR